MERFLLKEFANSPKVQTGVFGSETAGNIQYSEDPETIQSLKAWTEGLGSATSNATKQPAINDDQGIYKVLCKAIKNGQISGIPLYLETETYQIGSIVLNIENNEPVLYYSKTSNNIGNSLSDATNWAKFSIGASKNIGEIVYSILPINDSSLHLADGSIIQQSGIYNEFAVYLKNIQTNNSCSNLFTDETNWQSFNTTNGFCPKFVIDNNAGTIRLPNLIGYIKGTTTIADLGNIQEAGLPDHTHTRGSMNITGSFNVDNLSNIGISVADTTGAFYAIEAGISNTASPSGSFGHNIAGFDASRSWTGATSNASENNSIYGASSSVDVDSSKLLVYICLATSTKTDIQVDIDNIVTDLNNKVSLDGSNATFVNLSQTAKENIIDTSFGALQFSDMSKVGACFFQDLGNVGSATLPSGGTWFIYYSIRTISGIIEQTYSYLTAGGTVLGSNERVISILAIRVQ